MKKLYGVILLMLIGVLANALAGIFPVMGGPVIGLIIGIVIGEVLRRKEVFQIYQPGFTFTLKKLLKVAIVLLGLQMNFAYVLKVGSSSLIIMITTIVSSIIAAIAIGYLLRIPFNTKILIGVGTSICGGSAIMATAPVVDADENEVVHAISTIFLFNVVGAVVFPLLGEWLGMSDLGFGLLAGTAINDTSSVVAAASVWSAKAGNDFALEYATIVKLTRTLMIVPITFILALYGSYRSQGSVSKSNKKLWIKAFPWFVIYFLLVVIVGSLITYPSWLVINGVKLGKFMIVMAMTSVGMSVNVKYMIEQGAKPLLLGFACSVIVLSITLLFQSGMGLW